MPNRKWVPERYLDECTPSARATPDDWVVTLPGDAYGLAKADDIDPEEGQIILHDGDVVEFYWTESHGTAEFTVNEDGTWTTSIPEPATPEGGSMTVAVQFDWETAMDGIQDFATAAIDNDPDPRTETIVFYSWSSGPTSFVFQSGKFSENNRTGEKP